MKDRGRPEAALGNGAPKDIWNSGWPDTDVDRVLEGLRCTTSDAYRLIPGEGEEPDRWRARCPLHADSGWSLLVAERGVGDAELWCRVGCPPSILRQILLPDPEHERWVEAMASVLLWAQSVKRRRAA